LARNAAVLVLVVEDDPDLREMYRATLTMAGYAVAAVEDGVEALRHVLEAQPDLIVLDLILPRLGGYDVQRELASRAETREIPIVVVTGTDTSDPRLAHVSGVLQKPVGPDALVSAVERGLRAARRRPPVAARPDPRSQRLQRQGRTVLVVDDEVAVQKLLEHFLGHEKGYTVRTAASVGDAISILEEAPVDAVVLDVRMPRRSGLELLEFIRHDKVYSHLPVLILTGATLTPSEEAAITRYWGHVFYKSDDLEALAAQLDALTV
jgi:CheY-like chemotaxis protein